jgi:hypothetical protein
LIPGSAGRQENGGQENKRTYFPVRHFPVAPLLTVVSGKGRINGTRMTQIWRIIADKT